MPARLADLCAAVSLLLLVGLFYLWITSYQSIGTDWVAQAPGAEFHLQSRGGQLLIGILGDRPAPVWRWRPALRASSLDTLYAGNTIASFDLFGGGVLLPDTLLAFLLCIAPAWWLLVHRSRAEQLRRRQHGLCRHCGYDISHSDARCPECGSAIGSLGFRGNGKLVDAASGQRLIM
jgi:hypothetical protein